MNLIIFIILWVGIGLFAGVIVNWITEASIWPWFVLDLFAGATGAVLFGYTLLNHLFGMSIVLSVFSLIAAVAGACLCLIVNWFIRKITR